jgi:cytochrome P450
MVILLLLAGNETTVSLISNGMFVLFQHPAQFAMLKEDPALVKSAVEEILRYRGPLMSANDRWAREDFEFRGHQFKKGDMVYISVASANRDSSHCPHAEVFDITRKNTPHLSFGYGIHFCLGAPLARAEGQIALHSLLRRFPDIRLNVPFDSLEWRSGTTTNALKALPVAF